MECPLPSNSGYFHQCHSLRLFQLCPKIMNARAGDLWRGVLSASGFRVLSAARQLRSSLLSMQKMLELILLFTARSILTPSKEFGLYLSISLDRPTRQHSMELQTPMCMEVGFQLMEAPHILGLLLQRLKELRPPNTFLTADKFINMVHPIGGG